MIRLEPIHACCGVVSQLWEDLIRGLRIYLAVSLNISKAQLPVHNVRGKLIVLLKGFHRAPWSSGIITVIRYALLQCPCIYLQERLHSLPNHINFPAHTLLIFVLPAGCCVMFGACCDVFPVLAMFWVRQEHLFTCCFEGIPIGRTWYTFIYLGRLYLLTIYFYTTVL